MNLLKKKKRGRRKSLYLLTDRRSKRRSENTCPFGPLVPSRLLFRLRVWALTLTENFSTRKDGEFVQTDCSVSNSVLCQGHVNGKVTNTSVNH